MKLARVLARLALLSLAAALFIGLTEIYADSIRPRFVGPDTRAARRRRPSEPQLGQVLSFVGEGILVAVFTVALRIVLRLRLSPVLRSEEQVILLDLNRGPKQE